MPGTSFARAPVLRPGDRVRLLTPASPFPRDRFRAGIKALSGLGLVPVFGREVFRKEGFWAGDDRARARSLEQALLDPGTQAVWCIRGGYGSARLLPLLPLPRLRLHPKVFVGFSDITALLLALSFPAGFVTIHGPVLTQLSSLSPGAQSWLRRLLFSTDSPGRVPLGQLKSLVPGVAEGRLLAGNLSLLASLVGTSFLPRLGGKILCIEDTAEEAYRLDRLFSQLIQAGVLRGVRGMVIGSLAGCKPAGRGNFSARRVLERAVAALGVPAVSGAAFGHQDRNIALPVGAQARLDARRGTLTLLEPAVRPAP